MIIFHRDATIAHPITWGIATQNPRIAAYECIYSASDSIRQEASAWHSAFMLNGSMFRDTATAGRSKNNVHMVSGVPSTSAARGDDLKCRPFRKKCLWCGPQKIQITRQNF